MAALIIYIICVLIVATAIVKNIKEEGIKKIDGTELAELAIIILFAPIIIVMTGVVVLLHD